MRERDRERERERVSKAKNKIKHNNFTYYSKAEGPRIINKKSTSKRKSRNYYQEISKITLT